MCSGFVTTSEHKMWRVRVLETPFGLLFRFIYDFTSRHYNYFPNETRPRLTASSLPCWFFVRRCWSDLTPRFWSACLVHMIWLFISDRPWFLWSDVSSLIVSFDLLLFFCSPPWNRVLAPRIEDTLSRGNFSSVVQVVMGITLVNIRCSDNNCLPSHCLGIATICLSNITCIWEPLHSKWPYPSQYISFSLLLYLQTNGKGKWS
jgi:hypothetical protein